VLFDWLLFTRDSLSSGIFLLARIAINHDNYQLRLNPTLLYSYAPITRKLLSKLKVNKDI